MSLYRYDPPAGTWPTTGAIRPVRAAGPIVCRTCGCRLEAPAHLREAEAEAEGDAAGPWRHFSAGHMGRDARGCTVGCVELDHGPDGSVIA